MDENFTFNSQREIGMTASVCCFRDIVYPFFLQTLCFHVVIVVDYSLCWEKVILESLNELSDLR